MTAHGHFHWNEFRTRDVEGTKRFYGDTIGWTFEGMPMPGAEGTYWIAHQDGQPVAGMVDMAEVGLPAEIPEHWFAFLAVDDVDSRLAKAKAAGATVILEPSDIAGVGRVAILRQPGGAAVGWMTPAQSS